MSLLGLDIHAWYALATLIALLATMIFTKIPEDIIFFFCIGILIISGALPIKTALGCFSDSSVVTIGVLFVVIAGLEYSGTLQWMIKHLLGSPKTISMAMVKLMLPVALLSSFLSNTAVVAMFVNIVKKWANKLKIAPSKLLLPLSAASSLGGVCTLIGTPPNLIISGMYAQDTGDILNIFSITIPGLFCLFIGILSFIVFSKLLPSRKAPDESFKTSSEYTVELLVPTNAPSVGQSVKEAGLDIVSGGRLIEIIRFDREIISPVQETEFIFGGDRLIYSGQVNEIMMLRNTHQLVSATHHVYDVSEISRKRNLKTAYVTYNSSLIGKTMIETGLEEDNNMVLVAVARQGERINASPREIQFKAGDTLLLEGDRINPSAFGDKLSFFDSEEAIQIGTKTIVSTLIITAMIVLAAFKIIPLLHSCFLAAFAMIFTRCCNLEQVRKSINWKLLFVIAGCICIGSALEESGIAKLIADRLLNICGTNPLLALILTNVVALIMTELLSNTATAAIMYPIAYHIAITLSVNPLTFLFSLMLTVSLCFATPIGSPAHMIVYGPGGYRFMDFVKIGIIQDIIILASNLFIVLMLYPF